MFCACSVLVLCLFYACSVPVLEDTFRPFCACSVPVLCWLTCPVLVLCLFCAWFSKHWFRMDAFISRSAQKEVTRVEECVVARSQRSRGSACMQVTVVRPRQDPCARSRGEHPKSPSLPCPGMCCYTVSKKNWATCFGNGIPE